MRLVAVVLQQRVLEFNIGSTGCYRGCNRLSTTCGVQTYDIAIDDLTASGSWEVSPASAVLFDDPHRKVLQLLLIQLIQANLTESYPYLDTN